MRFQALSLLSGCQERERKPPPDQDRSDSLSVPRNSGSAARRTFAFAKLKLSRRSKGSARYWTSHNYVTSLKLAYVQATPWLAVLTLLQTMLAERADCARQIQLSWLKDLDYSLGKPAQIRIKKVNLKTVCRTTPLAKDFAHALFDWMHHEPLRGAGKTQWAVPGTRPISPRDVPLPRHGDSRPEPRPA